MGALPVIEHATRGTVDAMYPLIEAYVSAVPDDPWAGDPVGFFNAIRMAVTTNNAAFLVALGRDPQEDRLVGFLLAELMRNPKFGTLVAIIHAAYVEPRYRTRALRMLATAHVEGWARAHGASGIGCLAERGRAMARLTGWQPRGQYYGRDFLFKDIVSWEAVGDATRSVSAL